MVQGMAMEMIPSPVVRKLVVGPLPTFRSARYARLSSFFNVIRDTAVIMSAMSTSN